MFVCNKEMHDFSTGMGYMDGLGDRELSKGSKGPDVKELQQRLIIFFSQRGEQALPRYKDDGDFGAETETWLKKYQTIKGLRASGFTDKATYEALGISTATVATPASGGSKSPASVSSSSDMKRMAIYGGVGLLALVGAIISIRKFKQSR